MHSLGLLPFTGLVIRREKTISCQGNILVDEKTVEDMSSAFENTKGDLADKLLAVMRAADQPGRGDVRGKQSAALLIVRNKEGFGGYTDRWVDIRVDEHFEPIKELNRIFQYLRYDLSQTRGSFRPLGY